MIDERKAEEFQEIATELLTVIEAFMLRQGITSFELSETLREADKRIFIGMLMDVEDALEPGSFATWLRIKGKQPTLPETQ